jgi:hypothetical protein
MRALLLSTAVLLGLVAPSVVRADTLSGEYIESRSCSVYIGACHANGELVTEGKQALMVWHVEKGDSDGVDLSGLNVVAVVTANENLNNAGSVRKTLLMIDSKATADQKEKLAAAIQAKYGEKLGEVTAIKSATVEYGKKGLEHTVRVPGVAYLKTTRFACDHCVMPHMQWYQPLVGLKSSLVARANVVEFKGAPELDVKWKRIDENNSFVGQFSL